MSDIFNFNRDGNFDLNLHYAYLQPLNDKTTITILPDQPNPTQTSQPPTTQLQFDYLDPRETGGLTLALSTIPGIVYHTRITGQLYLGDRVFIEISNQDPVMNLIRQLQIVKGYSDTETQSWRALSNNTILTIKTNVDCFLNFAPYQFQLIDLQIVPDQNICKGYFEGPQGPTGAQGAQGYAGPQGIQLPQGPNGRTGSQGPIGIQGIQGQAGQTGSNGSIGRIGTQGIANTTDAGPIGFQGNQGSNGIQGSIGSQGNQGSDGPIGNQGPLGPIGKVGPTGPAGGKGSQGSQGVTGPQGIEGIILGNNMTVGSFNSTYTRDGLAPVSVTIQWQKVDNTVTLFVPSFFSDSAGAATNAVLQGTVLPNAIRTSSLRQTYYPVIINLNGTNIQALYRVGGTADNEFYRSLLRNDPFLSTDDIVVHPFSITYYLP